MAGNYHTKMINEVLIGIERPQPPDNMQNSKPVRIYFCKPKIIRENFFPNNAKPRKE
jgi:hypothetical protein